MNFSMIRGMFNSLSERTKLIGVAVIAFLLGMFFSGGTKVSNNGRYVPLPNSTGSSMAILDTSTGQTWLIDPNDTSHYHKGPSLSSWF